ncbi:MAG: PKD domain-containing protein, partial [Bacteroidota bacterium]
GVVKRIDFGVSISNTVLNIDDIATIPTGGAREVELVNDGASWFGFVLNNNGTDLYRIDFDSALSNPTPATISLNLGLNADFGFALKKNGSKWYGFSDSWVTNVIHKIVFPDSCSAIVSTSSNIFPSNPIYTNNGTYNISLVVSDSSGNISFYVDSLYVLAAPVAGFFSTPTCLNTTVTFTDTSTISSGSIINWSWDFGDSSGINNSQNPTHVYTNDTTYTVTLTVTGSSGCSSVISQTIVVHNLPVAGFSFIDNQCSRTLVQFNDSSLAPAGDFIAAWEWNFGDSTLVDNSQNPLHSFDSSGTFIVQLIAFTNAGCSDTITYTITILSRPLADFFVSNTCIGQTTVFTNTTTGGVNVTYNWNFGDGNDTTLMNPTHNYVPTSQTYAVTLIDSSTNGCMDTIVKNVRISTPANPGFFYNPINICQGNSVQFIDTSTIAAGDTIDHSTWNFGDSATLFVGDTITHIYADTGTYIITLTATALTACDTSLSITVHVLESPIANFTSTNNVCLGAGMSFYDSSYIPAGTQVDSIVWDFGDSTYALGDTVAHVYATAGTYNVIQTVYNNFGCYGTVTHQVSVYAVPQALFIRTSPACTGKDVQFTDLSYVQNDIITNWIWDLGNGSSTLQNPVNTYSTTGNYSISLIVTSLHGCQATITNTVTVYETPLFTFTTSLFCLGDSTHFTFIPLNSVQINVWNWYFGDFIGSQYPNPIHVYSSAGNFNDSLVVTSYDGCSNTVSQTITINPKPVAGILSDTTACSGTSIIFNDSSTISSGTINQWSWDFGDGSATVTSQNTSHNYGNDSTYNVIHTVVSDLGCADNDTINITIVPMPVASFTPNPTFGSPPLQVQFNNTSTGAISYQWTFGDGGTDIGFSPSYTYLDTGYFAVTLIATNSYGCSDTAYSDISVLIPYLDLAVKEIHSFPNNDLLSLKADLVNLGNTPIYKFQISAKIQNGSPINEQWSSSVPLNPGKPLPYAFTARYVIDPFNIPSFYCIEISEINGGDDAVESNNKKCASIGDLFELFGIYPNPVNDQINISMNVPLDGTIDITIYNSIGQLVKLNAEIPVTKGYNEFNYSLRNFAKGIYAISVKYRDDIRTQKVLKK